MAITNSNFYIHVHTFLVMDWSKYRKNMLESMFSVLGKNNVMGRISLKYEGDRE